MQRTINYRGLAALIGVALAIVAPGVAAQIPGQDMPAAVPYEVVRERTGLQLPTGRESSQDSGQRSSESPALLPGRGMPADASESGFAWSRAERGQALVTMAETYLGLPYLYGGAKPQTGFDCSGYTGYLYSKFGIALPRSAYAQSVSKALKSTRRPAPGDLVFFKINYKRVSHVGMYVGGDIFIHSPRTGKNVEFGNLKLKYWKTRFAGASTPF
ncbi:MAG: C40 family peptidase [bacterium]|nr:C40 family peptidase [bacterium]